MTEPSDQDAKREEKKLGPNILDSLAVKKRFRKPFAESLS